MAPLITQSWFRAERESYRRLFHLQGTVLPMCYAAIQVVPSPSDSHVPQSFVYGLILEDVGGVDLTEIDVSTNDYTSLGHSLMAAASTFPAYGVLHGDVRSHNILIAPPRVPASPHRITIIDFGHATLRSKTMTEEKWQAKVDDADEVQGLRWILHIRHIRDRSPFDLRRRYKIGSYGALTSKQVVVNNSMLNDSSIAPSWRLRWYDPGPAGVDTENVVPHWILKYEVEAWLDSRPPPPQRFLLPRPGSPEFQAPLDGVPLHAEP